MSKSKKRKSRKKKKINPRVNPGRAALIERVKKSEHLPGTDIIIDPPNKEKMSEVIKEFVAPFIDACIDNAQIKTLVSLGFVVWNASLFPEKKQKEMLNKIKDSIPILDEEEKNLFYKDIIEPLFKRKKDYFSSNTRMIVDYQFSEHNGVLNFDVVSTLSGKENG